MARDASISAVVSTESHLGTGVPYKGKWEKFRKKAVLPTIEPEDVPENLSFLRAALAAAKSGTLNGGDE